MIVCWKFLAHGFKMISPSLGKGVILQITIFLLWILAACTAVPGVSKQDGPSPVHESNHLIPQVFQDSRQFSNSIQSAVVHTILMKSAIRSS